MTAPIREDEAFVPGLPEYARATGTAEIGLWSTRVRIRGLAKFAPFVGVDYVVGQLEAIEADLAGREERIQKILGGAL